MAQTSDPKPKAPRLGFEGFRLGLNCSGLGFEHLGLGFEALELGFEDLGLEGGGGLGWPWLAGLGSEDLRLGFDDPEASRRPTLHRPTKPGFQIAKPVSKCRSMVSKMCSVPPKPLAVLRYGGRGFARKL